MRCFYDSKRSAAKLVLLGALFFSFSFGQRLVAQCTINNQCPIIIHLGLDPGECESDFNVLDLLSISNDCSSISVSDPGPYGIGVTNVTVDADDGQNFASCIVQVTVSGFASPITSLACNNLVQVSLDENCQAVIGADLVLEGGPYACYDSYTVELEGLQSNVITEPGTYGVTVTDPVTGNSCWGEIVAEDKIPPVLECRDVTTDCSQGTYPGTPIIVKSIVPTSTDPGDLVIPTTPGSISVEFMVNTNSASASLTDVNVRLDISHTFVSQLSATLQSPEGTIINLFNGPGSLLAPPCDGDDLLLELDDEASLSYNDLLWACENAAPAVDGSYRAQSLLSAFDSEDPNGLWTLTITDNINQNGGLVNGAELEFFTQTGTIYFPNVSGTPISNGDDTFVVVGNGPCGLSWLSFQDDEQEMDCSSIYSKVITRTWTGHDPSGNESSCVQTIYVIRKGLDYLKLPPHYDDLDLPSINCKDIYDGVIPLDPNTGHPSPSYTGVPYDWSSLDGEFCENIQLTYEDVRIDICPGSYKVIRKWLILDWCTGEIVEYQQIIKVLDNEGPVISCEQMDFTVSTDPYYCAGIFVPIPLPDIIFDCSEVTLDLAFKLADENGDPFDNPTTDGVIQNPDGSFTIEALPLGRSWLIYTATDECGNTSQCFFEVDVVDDIPPVAVCDEHTVVSVGADGMAHVYAETFDDLSTDNCEIDRMEVRKMTNQCQGEDLSFDDHVKFCCAEVGTTIMVEFRVFDASGNSNSCMVEVEVQDKLPPFITCPPDVTIDCHEDFTDLELTGEATAIDNCNVKEITYQDVTDLDQCGRGYIRRTWTAEDDSGLKHSCVQYIDLVDPDPFDESDIIWPPDRTLNGCIVDTDPSATGEPIINDDECSLVAYTYDDQVFEFVDNACRKILRKWSVIDWCTFNDQNPTLGQGYWEYVQIIKVNNLEAPYFTGTTCTDTTFCSYGQDCVDYIELIIGANDDCTPQDELVWSYSVDLYDDGSYDRFGSSNNASDYYADGTHRIKWTVEDKCGNLSTCEYRFTVVDCKNPTPYCITSVTTVVMPNTGSITIWASDFDFGSFDNCTPQDDLIFSFTSDVTDRYRTFTCDDIINGQYQTIQLDMWVTDEEGNQDFCEISVEIQDNNGDKCPDVQPGNALISGFVHTEEDAMVPNADVMVMSAQPEYPRNMNTLADGQYVFSNLLSGQTYDLTSSKVDAAINGVSTLDLVMMQKHILGIDPFASPYKVIASDVDNSQHVSAVDLVVLRKLILGIITEFPNGQESWRFVNAESSFADPADPFPFEEVIQFSPLSTNETDKDFMAVKIGDVNASASVDGFGAHTQADVRGKQALQLAIEARSLSEGEIYDVDVYAENFDRILGYQFTWKFDAASLTFVDVLPGALEVDESHFGSYRANAGILTTSWNDIQDVNVSSVEPLFTLRFETNTAVRIEEALKVTSLVTHAEAYHAQEGVVGLELTIRGAEDLTSTFELFQNEPNPFSERSSIGFHLPEASAATLTIYDVAGKVLFSTAGTYAKGYNQIDIDKHHLNASGVLYYKLETEQHTATKKMIAIE